MNKQISAQNNNTFLTSTRDIKMCYSNPKKDQEIFDRMVKSCSQNCDEMKNIFFFADEKMGT